MVALLSFYGDTREITKALAQGQDPNAFDKAGTSSVHKAAANGRTEALQVLVDKGGNVNLQDNTGCTSLHAAARNGHLNTLKWLVEHGGDIKVESAKGNTPRLSAKSQSQSEVVAYLKKLEREKFDWEPEDP
ncbi:uncharacterized protein LOC144439128 isoform X2 [Glandiceps talaboti]